MFAEISGTLIQQIDSPCRRECLFIADKTSENELAPLEVQAYMTLTIYLYKDSSRLRTQLRHICFQYKMGQKYNYIPLHCGKLLNINRVIFISFTMKKCKLSGQMIENGGQDHYDLVINYMIENGGQDHYDLVINYMIENGGQDHYDLVINYMIENGGQDHYDLVINYMIENGGQDHYDLVINYMIEWGHEGAGWGQEHYDLVINYMIENGGRSTTTW